MHLCLVLQWLGSDDHTTTRKDQMQPKRHQNTFIGERNQDVFNCLNLETILRAAKSEMARRATNRDEGGNVGKQHEGNCYHYYLIYHSCPTSQLFMNHESCTLKLSMKSLIQPLLRAQKANGKSQKDGSYVL